MKWSKPSAYGPHINLERMATLPLIKNPRSQAQKLILIVLQKVDTILCVFFFVLFCLLLMSLFDSYVTSVQQEYVGKLEWRSVPIEKWINWDFHSIISFPVCILFDSFVWESVCKCVWASLNEDTQDRSHNWIYAF